MRSGAGQGHQLRAGIYTRLSETYDAAESVPPQLANGERHAERRGWVVAGRFKDLWSQAGDRRIISAATHFGRQMKKERQAHGWTLQEFSVRTAYDGAHLSRIENGLRPPTRALALACDAAFPERHGWFLDYYEESRQWAEVPPGFRDWSEIEDKATHLQTWSPGIIHGLLQTEAYAAALLAAMPGATDEAIRGRLRARMERQRRIVFRDAPPALCFIVDEAALHRLVGAPDTMATQMRQLTAVAACPTSRSSVIRLRLPT